MTRTKPIRILSLSPFPDDHAALAEILQPTDWLLHHAARLSTAKRLLRTHALSVVVCEQDLRPYSWKDLVRAVGPVPRPPLVIVTSLHADDHLWAEALNLGAYDVLAKPFVAAEVRRAVGIAVLNQGSDGEAASRPLVRTACAVQ